MLSHYTHRSLYTTQCIHVYGSGIAARRSSLVSLDSLKMATSCSYIAVTWCAMSAIFILWASGLAPLQVLLVMARSSFVEYRSRGPGAAPDKRVAWSRQLTEHQATAYTAQAALRGWAPPIGGLISGSGAAPRTDTCVTQCGCFHLRVQLYHSEGERDDY